MGIGGNEDVIRRGESPGCTTEAGCALQQARPWAHSAEAQRAVLGLRQAGGLCAGGCNTLCSEKAATDSAARKDTAKNDMTQLHPSKTLPEFHSIFTCQHSIILFSTL